MSRVGMFAQGSGASIAILASASVSRIKVLDVLDPWADWPTWMASSPFVPEDERREYVKPEFLKKAALLEPIRWLPKVQAKSFRLPEALFESNTPMPWKDKLRTAVPHGATVLIYRTSEDFSAVVRTQTDLRWIKGELKSIPEKQQTKSGPLSR